MIDITHRTETNYELIGNTNKSVKTKQYVRLNNYKTERRTMVLFRSGSLVCATGRYSRPPTPIEHSICVLCEYTIILLGEFDKAQRENHYI